MPLNIKEEHEEINGVVDELADEYGRLINIVESISNQLHDSPNLPMLKDLLARFDISFVVEKLEELEVVIERLQNL